IALSLLYRASPDLPSFPTDALPIYLAIHPVEAWLNAHRRLGHGAHRIQARYLTQVATTFIGVCELQMINTTAYPAVAVTLWTLRSEERRVGKECVSRR